MNSLSARSQSARQAIRSSLFRCSGDQNVGDKTTVACDLVDCNFYLTRDNKPVESQALINEGAS
ncbi:hypothetical protein T4B_2697 [Trichinella pseudospiralis]|uniref:Uncharacterized protein n=1 Tax=Trichinella pseudospiralis TaxID=6337 RepID=A0A0V1EY42_TRIPS|nr:hypothetical protein T4E_683 [Trichinella pseudospiralis]KRY78533.1 hypothetical protein T4A_8455 [Trichinella pseudospiralis]KRZ30835.1 hypothetical protein T4B_2697 [Trichinella pseudospiralis]KRZ46299.1 hypothetical protein T4C_10730 [Trichinella pseudospiralis]